MVDIPAKDWEFVSAFVRGVSVCLTRYFRAQSTTCVNFPWIPVAEEMSVTVSDGDYGEETCED